MKLRLGGSKRSTPTAIFNGTFVGAFAAVIVSVIGVGCRFCIEAAGACGANNSF